MSTDASLTGWGAEKNNVFTRVFWCGEERSMHINVLELIAAFNSLKSFCSSFQNCKILIRMDSTTGIAYINKGGGCRSPQIIA
jgi:hypothetical protein